VFAPVAQTLENKTKNACQNEEQKEFGHMGGEIRVQTDPDPCFCAASQECDVSRSASNDRGRISDGVEIGIGYQIEKKPPLSPALR
jgi:hypothetical protein